MNPQTNQIDQVNNLDSKAIFLKQMEKNMPHLYQKGLQMIQGKTDLEIKQTVLNLAQQQGINLNDLANKYGIMLPNN